MGSTNVFFQTKGKGSQGTQRCWGSGYRQEPSHSLNGLCILSKVLKAGSQEQHVQFLPEEVSLTQEPRTSTYKGACKTAGTRLS